MTKIFISYRRQDTKLIVGRIFDRLKDKFGRDGVFMDIDGIPFGVDFRAHLDREVGRASAVLVLIGHGWAEAKDDAGRRRLDNPDDFVRIEIESALKRGIPLGAVLIDGAAIPRAEQLPESLQPLLWRNAAQLDAVRNFDHDMARLIADLGGSVVPPKPAAGSNLEWSAAEWERLKDSTDIARLKRFAEHAHPYYADEARERVQFLEAEAERRRTEAERRERERKAEGRIEVDAGIVTNPQGRWFLPGAGKTESFKDIDTGPEMVVVPAGTFMMGSPENEPERESWKKGTEETPQHKVTIAKPFAIGRHAITRGQFAAFVNATGHKTDGGANVWNGTEWKLDPAKSWRDPGFAQDDRHPVVCVNWEDAQAYTKWLSQKTGQTYRLPSEAEWEYVCRAGTTTPFWWGSAITPAQANYDGNYSYVGGGSKGEYRQKTVPVDSFQANPWGLYQVHGNAWEWCEDCWNENYNGAPTDGAAWTTGESGRHVLRGGSWSNIPQDLRSAFRNWHSADFPSIISGPLRANDDETTTCREFNLEDIGQTDDGHAPYH